MGRRKRNNYQSVDELMETGEMEPGLSQAAKSILEELGNEQENINQTNHVAQQLGRFARIDAQFEQAGVPRSAVTDLQEISRLSNGAPAPYVDTVSKPGIERRVHTREGINPFTQREEIVPVDNVNTGSALVTEFGKNVDMEGQERASEYVQDHILRLMGMNPERGGTGKVDFTVERGGHRVGIDGQAQQTGQKPVVEAFTKVIPTNRPRGEYGEGYAPKPQNKGRGTNSFANEEAIKRDVVSSLSIAMREGRTFDDAMGMLVDRGHFVDDRNIAGKLYKADYDAVLMPMQNRKQHMENAKYDDIAIAPDSVLMYNMSDVRDSVKGITDPNAIKAAYNAGDMRSKNREARVKLRADVPEQHVQDIVATNPLVAQLLRTLK